MQSLSEQLRRLSGG
ncbi:hypothetical protein [Citrobacter farmeri]